MRLGESLLLWKSKDKKCCLYEMPYVAAPIWVLGDVIAKFSALPVTSYRHTYKSLISFLVHKRHVSEEMGLIIFRLLCEILTRRSTSKSGTKKDYFLHYLRSPAKITFKHLCKQILLWLVLMSKTTQEPWRSRWPWERVFEQSAPTHGCHTHCISRQLGTTANWRYDIPQDWLWDACQIARVRWGTHCEGFCSKEGPHYHIEQSARNQGTWSSVKSTCEVVQKLSSDKQQSTLIRNLGNL